ncbi:MAG: hypothetical protein ACTTJH_01580 [Bacteroidales bacterium]
MKNIVYILIFSLLLSYSCTAQHDAKELIFAKEIVFDRGGYRCSGTFIDNGSFYIYVGEPVSRKELKIYNSDWELCKTIKLKSLPYLEYVHSLDIINMDSILIYIGSPLQRIYLIDSNANIKFQKDIPWSVKDDSVRMSLDHIVGNSHYNNYIYTGRTIYPTGKEIHSDSYNCDARIKCNRVARELPVYCRISLQDSSLDFEGFGQGALNHLYVNDTILDASYGGTYICNNLFFHAHYVNGYNMLLFNLDDNKFQKKLSLSSKIADFKKLKNVMMVGKSYNELRDINLKRFRRDGKPPIVRTICWNPILKQYYFLVDVRPQSHSDYFVIQSYDKDFNFIKEFKVKDKDDIDEMYIFKDKLFTKSLRENGGQDRSIVYKVYTINF